MRFLNECAVLFEIRIHLLRDQKMVTRPYIELVISDLCFQPNLPCFWILYRKWCHRCGKPCDPSHLSEYVRQKETIESILFDLNWPRTYVCLAEQTSCFYHSIGCILVILTRLWSDRYTTRFYIIHLWYLIHPAPYRTLIQLYYLSMKTHVTS